MADGNTYAINKYLDEREVWDELQEIHTELEQAEARIEELEDKLSGAKDFLKMHTAYSDADCRTIIKKVIAELSSTMKGQNDERQ